MLCSDVFAVAHPLCCSFSQALVHNLNRHYYSLNIDYRKNDLETKMLLNLHKKKSVAV